MASVSRNNSTTTMKSIAATALLAAVAQAQEPYYYKWSPETPVAPAFKFPENIPVPFPETNEPAGNAGYQYQYTPEQPNARPFKAPEDYTPVDFKYQYVSQPGDSFKYNYKPAPGEFDFTYVPGPNMMNLSPEEIEAKSAGVATSVRDVAALLSTVKSDDIKAITGELGFGQDFDLTGVSAGINKVGDFIENGGKAGAKIAADIGPQPQVPVVPVAPIQPVNPLPEPIPVQYNAAYQSSYPVPVQGAYYPGTPLVGAQVPLVYYRN
ncbi:hypothetical protein TCAL_02588 [Tigriopus californicus]|uniref:Uncharacterized protein n=1 Tax=Tigriopus californicus TaxID=6832 RepID=A0A553P747_TIGCA|nr:uncharacterized protein LOC131877654 [Tigriopus californicus]TRY73504.1 hypothetical protein TCAL_02588 [Tigriopus californicus]|eukprot:TCALIF_13135-PA protein Name:"Protein of unknown function" AED:0.32 eAED:0.32 QI:172/1/0.5/1/1/1/2/0/265